MFGKKIGFKIFYELTLMANRFYGKNTSKQSYKKGRLPSLDSSQLVNAIRMHQLTDLVTRPCLFGVKEEAPTPTKKPPATNNNRARDNNPRRRRLDTKEQKPAASRTLSTKMKKVVDKHNSKESVPLTMAAI